MRVRLKLELDCDPDTAWDLLRSPDAFLAVTRPILVARSLEPGGFPQRWSTGEHRVAIRFLGVIPVGRQVIRLSFGRVRDARVLTDDGGPTAGALTLIRDWRHRMAVSPGRRGGTLYRDQLEFGAGAASPLAWIGLWAMWQWRAAGIRRLAKKRGTRG